MNPANRWKLALVAATIGLGTGCLGGQEGEDYRPGGSTATGTPGSTGTSSFPWGTGTGGGTGTGTGGLGTTTDPGTGTPGTGDTGTTDTGLTDTGTPPLPACGGAYPTLYLSPDDSNSYAGAALSRARVEAGVAPGGAARIHELFNYYDFDVAPAPAGSVALTAEWLEDGLGREDYALQVHLAAEARDPATRPPINLTFVLDTSGSMSGTSIALLKESCEAIAAQLRQGDTVSMVTWDTANAVVLGGHAITGPSDPVLVGACDSLSASGGTNLSAGLLAGYAQTEAHYVPGQVNRAILISDGGANVGITDEDLIAEKAWLADGRAIFTLGIGVGGSNYNDTLMDTITDAGRGAAVFVDSTTEAWRVLGDRFVEVFDVAATDVRLELDLPEELRIVRASAEEISTNPDQVRPQYLAPNAEMVFYNELQTRLDHCLDDNTEITARATYVDGAGTPQIVTETWRLGDLRSASDDNVVRGRAIQLYGEALQAASTGGTALSDAVAAARAALDEADLRAPGDSELAEIRATLDAL